MKGDDQATSSSNQGTNIACTQLLYLFLQYNRLAKNFFIHEAFKTFNADRCMER